MSDPKPRVVISRCIEFEACRYNGAKIKSEFVLRLMPYVEFFPVCMEADMGLGVPRDPVRIVRVEGEDRLLQPGTGRDVTETALRFSREHLANLRDVDGFLLKNRSPSCGIKDVRVYPPGEGKAVLTGKSVRHLRPGGDERLPASGGGGRGPPAERADGRPLPHPNIHLGPLPGMPGEGNVQGAHGLPCQAQAAAHGIQPGGHAPVGPHNGFQGSDRGAPAGVFGRTAQRSAPPPELPVLEQRADARHGLLLRQAGGQGEGSTSCAPWSGTPKERSR